MPQRSNDPTPASKPDDRISPDDDAETPYPAPGPQPALISGMLLMVIGGLIAAPMGVFTVMVLAAGFSEGGDKHYLPALVACLLPALAGVGFCWAGFRMWRGRGTPVGVIIAAVAFVLLGLKACDSALRF